jgi:hypothetical protein
MPNRDLELEVLHRSRHEDYLHVFADPESNRSMAQQLRGWLTANRWDEGRWPEFELLVRYEGERTVRKRVRA